MVSLETGRVCLKIAGREAGKYCVVLKKLDESFVLVTGPRLLTGVKRRRCNITHLEPIQKIIEINENSSEEDILNAFEKAGLITELNLKKPSAAQLKSEKEKVEKKETKEKTKKESKKK